MTTKGQVLKAIRAQCLECCGGSSDEVSKCTSPKCSLYPFRRGKDPAPAKAGCKPVRAKSALESTTEQGVGG
jgi:hypothetical protein